MSESISDKSQIMFVDDGSKDRTWELIQQYSESNEHVSGLKIKSELWTSRSFTCWLNRSTCIFRLCRVY